ncbi:MAG TPA: SRPBCC family protein [Solirubrobacteraceae bacterium]|jgi:carbon monoxide dehydrogenase subunit G|nr:SRPBCC family protein [Solirubrobacteraceae bacterium]
MEISARRALPVPPEEAFAFLSQPHNHGRLATARIGVRELQVTRDGELHGALMVLRGPLWLRRCARTRVVNVRRPDHLAGTARVGSGTDVEVRWDLDGASAGTTVAILTATVTRLGIAERVLLAIGGRAWVRRLFVATLERLATELCAEPGRICPEGRREGQAWRLPTLIGANPRWR